MGWEWRVFFPLSDEPETSTDLWRLLHCKPWSVFPDRRTDVYLICSAGGGVKLRGRHTLEVKLRKSRDGSGAEWWDKVLYTPSGWDGKDTRELGQIVAKKTARQRDWTAKDTSQEQLQNLEAVLSLGSKLIQLLPLTKHRVTHHKHGVAMEQTDITVAIEGTPAGKWRSICLEGGLEEIKKLLQTAVRLPVTGLSSGAAAVKEVSLSDHLTEVAGAPCGYPEFVLRLQHSMEQPTVA